MRWNAEGGECQLYLDVDCSSITYETQPSAGILAAVDRANTAMAGLSTQQSCNEDVRRFCWSTL